MIWILLIVLLISLGVNIALGWAAWRRMLRNEEIEDFLIRCYQEVQDTQKKMEEIDHTGAFEADDEVGWTFQSIKNLIDDFADFLGVEEETTEKTE